MPAARSVLLALAALLAACGPARSPAGSPCTLATQCETRLCLLRGDGGLGASPPGGGPASGVCARRCADTTECTGDEVCGRYDYRPIDPDSGLPSGSETEIVRVCRPPLNPTCGPGQACAGPDRVCIGEPAGVCTDVCRRDAECASGRCVLPPACGAAGACAPRCDDRVECPRGWYCNQVGTPGNTSGRCDPITGADDAGTGGPLDCDASADL